jgi:hypothetical protein
MPYHRLSELARIGGRFQLECQQCHRRGWLAANEIWQRTGSDQAIKRLRFCCSVCGSKRVNVFPVKPGRDNIDRQVYGL